MMIFIIGRLTKDPEMLTTGSGKNYVSFDVAENKGFGENAKTQFHRCVIWGDEAANRFVNAKVKKGSQISICGEQELSAYTKKETGEAAAASQITVYHWEYVQSGKKSDDTGKAASGNTDTYNDTPTEDCDDGLPV